MHRMIPTVIAWATLGPACFTTELDPDAPGAFVCIDDMECPDALVCNGEVCTVPEDLVDVSITSPEPHQIIDFASFPSATTELRVAFNSTLRLVPPDDALPEPGTGYLRLTVDDQSVVISSGDASAGLSALFNIAVTPGAHRMTLQAFRPNGEPFPNPGATFGSLFWFDDGAPHIAVFEPWPGQVLPSDPLVLQPVVHALNFDLAANNIGKVSGEGHAHFYYDAIFPACAGDSVCDCSHFARTDVVLDPPSNAPNLTAASTTMGSIPASAPGTQGTITAMLRHHDHFKYRHPFAPQPGDVLETANYCGTEPIQGVDDGALVLDTVSVLRR